MRIRVTRTGGFAGVRLTTEVDDPDEAAQLRVRVRRAASESAPEPERRIRDDFVYEFEVLGADAVRVEVYDLPASALPDDLRADVRALVDRARSER